MPIRRIILEIKNDYSELDSLFEQLREFGHALGAGEKALFQMNLALEELVANIISYGYTDCLEHSIRITVSHDDGVLYFSLEDDGIPFNPMLASPADRDTPVEERGIGKLGIHLAREFMRDLAYERKGNKNVLTFNKPIGD